MAARTAPAEESALDPTVDHGLPDTDFTAVPVTDDLVELTSLTPVQLAALAALVEPFPPNQIGKLPKVTCGDCSNRDRNCTRHQKAECGICGNYLSTAHIHIDYVGHAALTYRLLKVDPSWNWEPLSLDPSGQPVMGRDGMWIKLTIAGVTRLGFGDGKSTKEIIGDALRNAGMRFGLALALWHKGGDLYGDDGANLGDPTEHRNEPARPAAQPAAAAPAVDQTKVDHILGLLLNCATAADVGKVWEIARDTDGITGSEQVAWEGGPTTLADAITQHGLMFRNLETQAATAEPPF